MTDPHDPLEQLRNAMAAQTPAPSTMAQDKALHAALKSFGDLQGNADPARPIQDGPEKRAGFVKGVKAMFDRMTTRPALAAIGGVCATAIAIMIVPMNLNLGQSTSTPRDTVIASDAITAPTQTAPKTLTPVVPEVMANAQDSFTAQQAEIVAAPMATRSLAQQSVQGRVQADMRPAPQPVNRPTFTENNGDQFPDAPLSGLFATTDTPVSTFSIDVDTASYAWMRANLRDGRLPDPTSVRIEEMVNYFDYAYPGPADSSQPFATHISVVDTPWNADTRLVHIALQGYTPPVSQRAPLNLVFLIDTSGSMQSPDKLPLLIQSLRMLLTTLTDADQVAIVTYAGNAGTALPPTPATERRTIEAALARLTASGGTAGQAGLVEAYALAGDMTANGETARVILATDGDFNIGQSSNDALTDYIAKERDSGTTLSVLGFGEGNYNDALMQALAQNGNGIAAYIDSAAEARRVLVENAAGTLTTIANDVKIQVEFNPATVAEYRLLGYETRTLNREDFNNDAVDAGEIGAGHSVTALYEITPIGSAAQRLTPSRYSETPPAPEGFENELGFLQLRYKQPGANRSSLITQPILQTSDADLGTEPQFAAAVAGFAALLQGADWVGNWDYMQAESLARTAIGDDALGYRTEFLNLIRTAQTLDSLR